MPARAERLFAALQTAHAVTDLIGEAEDAHFDCKEWPARDDDAQKMLAKAACGLTNADGGILVIGMKAESRPKDEPDVVTSAAPVSDTSLVKSRVLNLIGDLVEPGIVGLEATEIAESEGAKSGFVVIYVPKSEGAPRRSRKDWKFYQRIGSSTLPMEFWQIEAMFGKSPRPHLEVHLDVSEIMEGFASVRQPLRQITFGLRNSGRGLAKFPGIRFKKLTTLQKSDFGIDGNCGFGLPPRASEADWIVFRGGVDDVIYPGETRLIGKLLQTALNKGERGLRIPGQVVMMGFNDAERTWVCEADLLEAEVSAEGVETQTLPLQLIEATHLEKYRIRH